MQKYEISDVMKEKRVQLIFLSNFLLSYASGKEGRSLTKGKGASGSEENESPLFSTLNWLGRENKDRQSLVGGA